MGPDESRLTEYEPLASGERAGAEAPARPREDGSPSPGGKGKEELEITEKSLSSGPVHFELGAASGAGIHIDLHSNRHFDNLWRSPFHVFTSFS